MLEKAIQIAVEAHAGQVDKAGAPYILHPLRLMFCMDTPEEKMTAVLHDVVEDGPDWSFTRLRDAGIPDVVLDAVGHLTRDPDEDYEAFIDRAARHPIARRVKQADIEDNLNVLRISQLTERDLVRVQKYHRAWHRLQQC